MEFFIPTLPPGMGRMPKKDETTEKQEAMPGWEERLAGMIELMESNLDAARSLAQGLLNEAITNVLLVAFRRCNKCITEHGECETLMSLDTVEEAATFLTTKIQVHKMQMGMPDGEQNVKIIKADSLEDALRELKKIAEALPEGWEEEVLSDEDEDEREEEKEI